MLSHRPYLIALATIASTTVLNACTSAPALPQDSKPIIDLPAIIAPALASSSQVEFGDGQMYWKIFKDPILDALIAEANQNNQDLALASARIAESEAALVLLNASLLPSLDLNAGVSRRALSQNSASFNPSAKLFSGDKQFGLSASYEIDFWGRVNQADQAARARLLAAQNSRGVVLTTLFANTAQAYFQLRSWDGQVRLAEQILATRRENLQLQERRFKGGLTSQLDVSQAQSELANIENSLIQAKQAQVSTAAVLTVLLGRKPADILNPIITKGLDTQSSITALYGVPAVPANLPADVLNRRPDIQAAQQLLAAANADIALAKLAYYPRISLTASLGEQSKDLSNLFSASSLFWNLAGNLTAPIFRAGAIQAQVAAASARQQQAVAQYVQTVQVAFKDVHDALKTIDASRELVDSSSKRIDALATTLRLAQLRYKGGYSSYLEVLNAQRDLAQAQASLIDLQRAGLAATVSLYRALGAGWQPNQRAA